MPVIKKPRDRGPLLSGKATILLGGIDHKAMRAWQTRLRAAEQDLAEASADSERTSRNLRDKPSTD